MSCYVSSEHFNSSGSQQGLAAMAPLSNCTWLAIRWSRCTGCVAIFGTCNPPKHSLQGKNPSNPPSLLFYYSAVFPITSLISYYAYLCMRGSMNCCMWPALYLCEVKHSSKLLIFRVSKESLWRNITQKTATF